MKKQTGIFVVVALAIFLIGFSVGAIRANGVRFTFAQGAEIYNLVVIRQALLQKDDKQALELTQLNLEGAIRQDPEKENTLHVMWCTVRNSLTGAPTIAKWRDVAIEHARKQFEAHPEIVLSAETKTALHQNP